MNRSFVILFWCAAAFAFLMAVLPHPPSIPDEPPDKVQHLVAFAALALLASMAFPRVSLVRIGIGLAVFGGLIEIAQMIPELHRDAEWLDWFTDIGAIVVTLAATSLSRRSRVG